MRYWNLTTIFVITWLLTITTGFANQTEERGLIEIQEYTCSTIEKRDQLMQVFDVALIPALNRQGISPVGILWSNHTFNEGSKQYDTSLFVIIPYNCASILINKEQQLLADPEYMRTAASLFAAPMESPLFDTCHSSLLRGIATIPRVTAVTLAPERILQLRIYNSYTEERNVRKIEMFEAGGELRLFKNAGLNPVLFGRAITGNNLPNMTYLLSFPDTTVQAKAWDAFRSDPAWLKLKADPHYKNTANKITNIVLRPSPGSQL